MNRELRVVTRFGCVLIAVVAMAGSAFALSPQAEDADGLTLHSTLGPVTDEKPGDLGTATEVKPGETLNIVGDCVPHHSVDDVRVVLTMTDSLASVEHGFRSVLATDQEIHGDTLQVRVPDLPEAANRTFEVRVFRLGEEMPKVCSAGAIRIGGQSGGKVG